MKRSPFYFFLFSAIFAFMPGNAHAASPALQNYQNSQTQHTHILRPQDSRISSVNFERLGKPIDERPELKSTEEIKNEILEGEKVFVEGKDGKIIEKSYRRGVTFKPQEYPNITITSSPENKEIDFESYLFIRKPILISGDNPENLSKINLKSLNITGNQDNIVFENLDITGIININYKTNVIFRNCKIHYSPTPQREEVIQVSGKGSAFFENCEMCSSVNDRPDVMVRDHSYVYFNKCKFSSLGLSVLSLEHSYIQAFDCSITGTGIGTERMNLFFKDSKVFLSGCSFSERNNYYIYSSNSELDISQCDFKSDASKFNSSIAYHSCVFLSDKSKSKMSNCNFSDVPSTAVYCLRNSYLDMKNCEIKNTKGNAIHFNNGKGHISSCRFNDFKEVPPIAVTGPDSDPVIENCEIKNIDIHAITIKLAASPVIRDINISGARGKHLITCYELTSPVISNIIFSPDDTIPPIVASGASRPKIKLSDDINIEVIETDSIFSVLGNKSENNKNKLKILSMDYASPIICRDGDSLEPEKLDLNNIGIPAYNIIEGDNRKISTKCGHRINPDDFGKGDKVCHTCGMEVKGITSVFPSGDNECIICTEAEPLAIMLPCGHRCCCFKCANECKEKGSLRCPICTGAITNIKCDFADVSQLIKK